MKKHIFFWCLLHLGTISPVWSAEAVTPPPTRESVEKLLLLSNAKNLLDLALRQMQAVGVNAIQQSELNAVQKKVVYKYQFSISNLIRDEFSFEQLQSELMDVYQNTFSQKEVNVMINFYQTPEGQSMLRKMPVVSQQSMKIVITRAQQIQPKINKLAKQMQKELAEMSK